MTLDELLEALEELKRYMPSAGSAVVVGVQEPVMGGGRVFLMSRLRDDDEDDDDE